MLVGLESQLRRTQHHLGGVAPGLVTGQAAGDGAVGQRLQKQADEGAAAAGHGTAGVDEVLLQRLQPSGGGHQGQKGGQLLLRYLRGGDVQRQARSHGAGSVGHDPQDGAGEARHLPQALESQAGGHGHQHEALLPPGQDGAQPGQQIRHHLRLDPQKDVVAGLGDGLIVGDGGSQLLGQSLCLLRGAVGQQQLRRGGGLGGGMGQCAPHIAGADKADFHNVIPPCGNCGASAP